MCMEFSGSVCVMEPFMLHFTGQEYNFEKMEPDEIRNNRVTAKPATEMQGIRMENMINCCIDFFICLFIFS